MEKKKITKRKSYYIKFLPFIIFFISILMSIGYATINTINLDITGTSVALEQSGVLITNVSYKNNVDANTSSSKINPTIGSVLNSTVVLSTSNAASEITYTITLFNNKEYDCIFKETVYESNFYDNYNIIFELSNTLQTDTIIKTNESLSFDITFKYKDGVTPSNTNNMLNSYINFKFIRAPYQLEQYSTPGYYIYTIPESGIYRIQLWGAGGFNSSYASHAIGGYTQGDIELTNGTELHFYVGGKGTKLTADDGGFSGGGYNGGGNASHDGYLTGIARYGGGGATDVRIIGGEWNIFESLASRIMVAGGGGSWSQAPNYGGSAGGLVGYGDESDYSGGAGTQTSGGLGKTGQYGTSENGGFGYGGEGSSYASGGGGGYYGGGGGARDKVDGSGGGGSSFISGHEGCDAISADSLVDNIIHTGQSIHYSGMYFFNTVMIDGNGFKWTTTPSETSLGYLPGYTSSSTLNLKTQRDGYAIISRVPTE